MERRLQIMENARRIGSASIDSGQLTVRNGDIVVVDSNDNPTLSVIHGPTPIIRMDPGGAGGYRAAQFAWESGVGGATYESHIEQPNGTQDGGTLLLQQNAAYLSRQPNTGAEAFIAVGDLGLGTEHFRLRGRWVYNQGYDEQDAVVVGFDQVAAGFGASVYTFPYAFDQTPAVLVSLTNAGTAVAWDLAAISNTGFTVSWASGTTAKTICWVAFRR
jgi:hypothetical protein